MDVSPLSPKLVRACSGFVTPHVFVALGCSFQRSFRLKGGSYRIYDRLRRVNCQSVFSPGGRGTMMYSPSGIRPLPFSLWP